MSRVRYIIIFKGVWLDSTLLTLEISSEFEKIFAVLKMNEVGLLW